MVIAIQSTFFFVIRPLHFSVNSLSLPCQFLVSSPSLPLNTFQELQYCLVELLRTLIGNEMITSQEDEFCIRNMGSNQSCMFIPDHVIRSSDDQSLDSNGRQFFGTDIWVVHHQSKHLGMELRRRTLAGKQSGNPIPDFDGNLHASLHARGIQVGAIQYQTIHAFRIFQGKDHRYISSIREAQQMSFLDLMFVHEGQQVVGKLPDGEWRISTWRLSVPSRIQGIDMKIGSKRLYLVLKIPAILPIAMQEENCRSLSFFIIEMLNRHSFIVSSRASSPGSRIPRGNA